MADVPVDTAQDSMWNLRTLSEAVLAAPTDRGTINVWLARDLARAALASVPARSPDDTMIMSSNHSSARSPDTLTEALTEAHKLLWWFIEQDHGDGNEIEAAEVAARAIAIQDDVITPALASAGQPTNESERT